MHYPPSVTRPDVRTHFMDMCFRISRVVHFIWDVRTHFIFEHWGLNKFTQTVRTHFIWIHRNRTNPLYLFNLGSLRGEAPHQISGGGGLFALPPQLAGARNGSPVTYEPILSIFWDVRQFVRHPFYRGVSQGGSSEVQGGSHMALHAPRLPLNIPNFEVSVDPFR